MVAIVWRLERQDSENEERGVEEEGGEVHIVEATAEGRRGDQRASVGIRKVVAVGVDDGCGEPKPLARAEKRNVEDLARAVAHVDELAEDAHLR